MTDHLATHSLGLTDCSESQMDTEIDRQFPRNDFRGHAQATIFPPAGTQAEPRRCTVLTRDLSNRGFGIAHNEPLRPKQVVELQMPARQLTGEVLWCRQIRPEFYIIGCRLIAAT